VGSDGAGNSYVAGQFNGTATFQATPTFTLTAAGGTSSDILVAKWLSSCSGTTGISAVESKLNLYPDPASREVMILAPLEGGTLTITNGLGQQVFETRLPGGSSKVDISQLAPGIYFVNLGTKRSKLIKE
jgi:hypothetical protein